MRWVILVAYGVARAGCKQIVDFQVASSENEATWRKFLWGLHRRGLTGVHLRRITMELLILQGNRGVTVLTPDISSASQAAARRGSDGLRVAPTVPNGAIPMRRQRLKQAFWAILRRPCAAPPFPLPILINPTPNTRFSRGFRLLTRLRWNQKGLAKKGRSAFT